MESAILVIAGFIIGTFGTLIGAGGGFILVPLLLIFYPQLGPELTTAISIAVVSVNAISGTAAYARSGRIDYKAGLVFAAYTIPGSILGVLTVQYIPKQLFNIVFGILLLALSIYLFLKNKKMKVGFEMPSPTHGRKQHNITDKEGITYKYCYNQTYGNIISVVVGYISPLLGIGGGIIHVPAMVNWLKFPVRIATATSHFILAVMATVSVITHAVNGTYENQETVHMILFLAIGVVPGAQLGAMLSHKIKSHVILQVLAGCLVIVGIRILICSFY
ncbi:sulfite exporter TauE/SafE family protein [Flavobacterium subsaxonicum]|uniref:Probable membrane transporter protein n=1 Tax=Flavobacterium subsaxonicum WB 4.1-42 = DSM 21790 TaxID=1121898 RepID=A0A0A2N2M8_9FLAO|nr:sulfite exporter TauE/SafE family protein [Flavobacterium subsaxonicum]KGO94690.1 membrane protein [Flavobacterium subsaxonicum WB 4.1-42 = DSM 21790]